MTTEELTRRALSSSRPERLFLGRPEASIQLALTDNPSGGAALLLPLDADLPSRLAAAETLWLWLNESPGEPLDAPTAQQAVRLVAQLRALDGKLLEVSVREIATTLFGEERLPVGRDWRAHDLRNRTRRLIDGGLKLMRGAYLTLIKRF